MTRSPQYVNSTAKGKIKVMLMTSNVLVAELAFSDYKAAYPEMNKVVSGRLPSIHLTRSVGRMIST